MNTAITYNFVKTKTYLESLKTCLQRCVCDPYDLCRDQALLLRFELLRGVLFIVRAGADIIKAKFMHTKRTNCLTKMKIGIHLEELK